MVLDDVSVDRARAAWYAIGAVLAAILAYVTYAFLGTIVLGIFVYYATRPIHRRLRRQIGQPTLAAAASLVLLALPILLLVAYTFAIAVQELSQFTAAGNVSAGNLQRLIDPYVNLSQVASDPREFVQQPNVQSIVTGSLERAGKYLGAVLNGLLHLFVTITIAFYLLRDGDRLSRWFRSRFGDQRGLLAAYMHAVDRDLQNVFFGNILNAIFTAAIGAFAYTALDAVAPDPIGIPYPVLLGVLTGVGSLIPVVGMKIVYFPVVGYLAVDAYTASGTGALWFPAAFFVVSFLIVDSIPDLLLRPYVSGRNLHVGSVMLAYIFGPLLFGWYGLFLGPLLLVLGIHFARIVLPELVSKTTVRPFAVDPTYLTDANPGESTDDDETC
ncbi:MAG TPA: AI-2E family transporter [Natrialbaceae archaeon]|nr:AI-2E family transporter [Natrialbaceae archaeon]